MSLQAFKGMTREKFMGNPAPREPMFSKLIDFNISAAPEPFLGGKFTAKFATDRANVYDGGKVIAHIKAARMDSGAFTAPTYRKQGIGFELAYQLFVRMGLPYQPIFISTAMKKICGRVWDRIQKEIGA